MHRVQIWEGKPTENDLPDDEFPKSLGGLDFSLAQALDELADDTGQP